MKPAKKDVVVLHPGPINRGVEITSDVADGPNNLILDQVTNGVPVRSFRQLERLVRQHDYC